MHSILRQAAPQLCVLPCTALLSVSSCPIVTHREAVHHCCAPLWTFSCSAASLLTCGQMTACSIQDADANRDSGRNICCFLLHPLSNDASKMLGQCTPQHPLLTLFYLPTFFSAIQPVGYLETLPLPSKPAQDPLGGIIHCFPALPQPPLGSRETPCSTGTGTGVAESSGSCTKHHLGSTRSSKKTLK